MRRWNAAAAVFLALVAAFLPASSLAANVAELRAVPQVRLDAAPLDLAPLAGRVQAAIPSVAALDLKVPAANAGIPAGPGAAAVPAGAAVTPSIYATERARALLGRLAEAGAAKAGAPVVAAEPAQAKKTIAAVNAVLKDFTPEQLSRLPQEQLAALSGVLFDHMDGREGAPDAAAAAVLSQASGRAMLDRRPAGLTEVVLNPGHNDSHPDDIEVRGVPQDVKPVDSEGVVWRHYTTEEGYKAIVEWGALQNGFVPYVRLSPGLFKKVFKDVGGLFLTKPGVDGSAVGVPKREFPRYVDVVLPAALTVLEVEAGRIWLVPLPGRTRGWVAGLYRQWAESGKADGTYARMVAAMDASGGPGPQLSVPVRIVKKGATE